MRRWLIAFVIVACGSVLAASAAQARRVALVIGNSAYKVGPLANPGNDADAVAAAFKGLGFDEVLLRKDLGVEGFRTALSEMAGLSVGAEVAVIFFAGHGTERDGRNYLIPVDARLDRASDLDLQAIALSIVLDQIAGATKLRLVILDACRNNVFPLAGAKRSTARGLARVEPEDNTLIAYAAKEGTLADDGVGAKNSPFTRALLKHLGAPGLEVQFIFRHVRDEVVRATRSRQVPHVYGTLGGEAIYLNQKSIAVAVPPPAAPQPPAPSADDVVADLIAAIAGMTDAPRLRPFTEHRSEAVRKAAAARLAALAPPPSPEMAAKAARFATAVQVAALLGNDSVNSLATIARAQAKAGLRADALATLAQVETLAASIKDTDYEYLPFTILEVQLEAGAFEQALGLVPKIPKEDLRDEAFAIIVEAMAKSGRMDESLQAKNAIKGHDGLSLALIAIAEAQAKAGSATEALATFGQALQHVREIKDAAIRADRFIRLIDAHQGAGLVHDASMLLREALQAEQLGRKDRGDPDILIRIAKAQHKAGLGREATVTLTTALAIARDYDNDYWRPEQILEIASVQAETGPIAEARATAALALRVSLAIPSLYSRASAVNRIAVGIAGGPLKSDVASLFGPLAQLREAIVADWTRVGDLVARAERQLAARDGKALAATLEQLLKMGEAIANEEDRKPKLEAIREAQTKTQEWLGHKSRDPSAYEAQVARYALAEIKDKWARIDQLIMVAEAQSKVGLTGEAANTFDAAHRIAKAAREHTNDDFLLALAKSQAGLGLIKEAVATTRSISYPARVEEALLAVGEAQGKAGQKPETAATLAEAAKIARTFYEFSAASDLSRIAELLWQAGLTQEAKAAVAEALRIALTITDEFALSALGSVARAQGRVGMHKEALESLLRATELQKSKSYEWSFRDFSIADVVRTLAE